MAEGELGDVPDAQVAPETQEGFGHLLKTLRVCWFFPSRFETSIFLAVVTTSLLRTHECSKKPELFRSFGSELWWAVISRWLFSHYVLGYFKCFMGMWVEIFWNVMYMSVLRKEDCRYLKWMNSDHYSERIAKRIRYLGVVLGVGETKGPEELGSWARRGLAACRRRQRTRGHIPVTWTQKEQDLPGETQVYASGAHRGGFTPSM